MNLEELFTDVEAACPGFFAGLDLIVTGVPLDDIANNFVDVVNTETKSLELGAKLTAFQRRLNELTPDDVSWLQARTASGIFAVLADRHQLQTLRRGGGVVPVSREQIGAALEVTARMKLYADACRHLVGQLHHRAHVVEHHWNDMPVA